MRFPVATCRAGTTRAQGIRDSFHQGTIDDPENNALARPQAQYVAIDPISRAADGQFRLPAQRLALKPRSTIAVQLLDRRAFEHRHVALDDEADFRLRICEVTVALRKLGEERNVELEDRARIDRIDAVFFVDRLGGYDRPTLIALFEEIVKASGAHHVAEDPVDGGALGNGHLGLSDRSRAGDIDGRSAEKMQDADALVPAFAADLDEALGGSLDPGCHHAALRMPDGAEPLPISRVAPDDPVFDDLSNAHALDHCFIHVRQAPMSTAGVKTADILSTPR